MKKNLLVILTLLLAHTSPAQRVTGFRQDNDESDPYEHASYFMYGLNYLSNNVYLGRKDSVRIPYITPYAGYHFKSGFYARALLSYTSSPKAHVDLTTLEAGYDHSFNEHINGGINLDKFFYSKTTTSIRANTSGSLGLYGQYTNDWIEPQVSLDANLNKKSADYVVGVMLDHDFSAYNSHLHIVPAVAMNSGTQHYYDEYFTDRLNKKGKPINGKAIANASRFVALDYELSAKATYYTGKWLFALVPVFAIPTSPSTISLPNSLIKEKISNTFYIELDICHR
jgi:hypothetical protein